MAINNWRTIIGGYQWNDWNTYVEYSDGTVWVQNDTPTVNTNTFTPWETFGLQAQGYYNMWDNNMWDAYSKLWKWSDVYSSAANDINSFYNQLYSDLYNREWQLWYVKSKLNKELVDDIANTKQMVMDYFWPNGSLTKEMNEYYGDLWNYLQTDAWRQAATIAAQGVHSGASLGAIRAQQNEAYNESFARYVQAKEQEINAKQKIAAQLIDYMSALRQEYGNTNNQYIIQHYERVNDMLNAVNNSMATNNVELRNAKLSRALAGSWGSSNASGNLNSFNTLNNLARAWFNSLWQWNYDELSPEEQQVITQYYLAWLWKEEASNETSNTTTTERNSSSAWIKSWWNK